jgi:hypothetical protein
LPCNTGSFDPNSISLLGWLVFFFHFFVGFLLVALLWGAVSGKERRGTKTKEDISSCN